MKNPNTIIGIIVILFAAFFFALTFQFPKLAIQETGPGFMPRIYCGLLILLGGSLLIQGFKEKNQKEGNENTMGYALAAMGLVFLYLILIPFLGFYISTAIFVFILLLFSKVRNKIVLAAISIGTVLFIFIFFEKLLKVAIPVGMLFS